MSLCVLCSLCFQGSEQESKGLPCKKGIVQSIVGQGYHRKIVLASQAAQNTIYRSVSENTGFHTSWKAVFKCMFVDSEGQSAAIDPSGQYGVRRHLFEERVTAASRTSATRRQNGERLQKLQSVGQHGERQ